VRRWQKQNPAGKVIHHNTTHESIPYLDEAMVDAYFTPPAALTPEQERTLACSDKFVDELLAADVIVLGVPMWNLSIPASLKAWIDMIVREGRTFAFSAQGAVPLVPPGKKVYVFTGRGGAYPVSSPFHSLDHQEPYLRAILSVIGLTQIEFIHAEHQSEGPEAAAEGLAVAQRLLESIAA
jgi:FMN-dependent NADH-azoreductase